AALPLVVAFLEDEREPVRQRALQFCAATGEPDAIEAALAALDGPDCSDALRGIRKAATAGKIAPEQRERVFDRVLAGFETTGKPSRDAKDFASALIAVDGDRARAELTAPRWLHPREAAFGGILEAFDSAELDLPAAKLRELLD